MKEAEINKIILQAIKGDKTALNKVLSDVKDLIYNLSLRMLLYPEDAEDATQEILIKVITHLSTFKSQSSFKTWVYKIATNYLITTKGKLSAQFEVSFEDYENLIDTGISEKIAFTENLIEQKLLEEEVKISCTHGLLLCLNSKSRLVYILGDIFEFNSIEASEFMDISPENFRQILSRSRKKIKSFLQSKCGLVNKENPCRCKKKIDFLIENDAINPSKYRFANHSQRSIDLVNKIDLIDKSLEIYRSTPKFKTPIRIVTEIKEVIEKVGI